MLAGVVLVRRSFPQTSGDRRDPGLDSEVEVVRDERGIPQIYADSIHDLMLAQGYVHAQERFYEMDVRRHATAGRLAEMFGEDALETDMYVRTMGWRNVAERELPLLQPDTRAALDSYADGVNAYLADRSPSEISLEYTVLERRRPRLPPGRLDRRGLARLAEGDGVGPARQHAGRDRPGARAPTWSARSGRRRCSRRTPTTSTIRSSARAPSSTGSSSRTP